MGVENLVIVYNFQVTTSESIEDSYEPHLETSRVPDHSLLFWNVLLDGWMVKRRLIKVALVIRE